MLFGLFGKKNKETCLAKGDKLAAQGRVAEAVTWYQDALDLDPNCEDARAKIKECRTRLVDLNIEEAEAFLSSEPDKAAEHARLALQLAEDDRELAKKAGDVLAKVTKAAPRKPKEEAPKRMFEPSCGCASPSCGPSSCKDQGHDDDEEEEDGEHEEKGGYDVRSEFQEDPDDLFYFYLDSADPEEKVAFEEKGDAFRRAYVALLQGEGEEAGKWLGKARAEEEDKASIFYLAGLLAWQKMDGTTADRLLFEATRANPDFTPAFKRRAMLLREAQRPADAARILAPVVEQKNNDKELLTLYAASLAESGKAAEAVEVLGPYAREGMKTDAGLALLWAHILRTAGNEDEAIGAARIATTLSPNAVDAQEVLGIMLIRKGGRDAEGAVKAFKQCYRLNGEKGWYYLLRIAESYAAMGQSGEAGKFLEEARKELPDTKEARSAWETVSGIVAAKG